MPIRATLKVFAQRLFGRSDLRGVLRTRQLQLQKMIHRRPIAREDFKAELLRLGVTPGRTLWVQSSWNQFFNLAMRPSEVIDLLLELIGPQGTLAMPAFAIDPDPAKVYLADRAPVSTGLLCEIFRRYPGVRRSIHLSSSVCALGPNADFLVKDHHRTAMTWGSDSPFGRLRDVNARLLILGGGFEFMTPLHCVECLLYDDVPYFHGLLAGRLTYTWKRATGESGEHTTCIRDGTTRPRKLRRYFDSSLVQETRLSNLRMLAADAKPFIEHAVALGRKGITMYIEPVPRKDLFAARSPQ